MTIEIKMIPAVIFYVLYLAGLAVFAISPVLYKQSWLVAAGVVLLLIVFAYVTYPNGQTKKLVPVAYAGRYCHGNGGEFGIWSGRFLYRLTRFAGN